MGSMEISVNYLFNPGVSFLKRFYILIKDYEGQLFNSFFGVMCTDESLPIRAETCERDFMLTRSTRMILSLFLNVHLK